MAFDTDLYSLEWFRRRTKSPKGPHVSSGHLADLVYAEFAPKRVIDLGSGTCAFANRMGEHGVDATAIDGSPTNAEFATHCRYFGRDLSQPLDLDEKFDLVTSWDVLEHIPAECEAVAVQNVINLASDWLLLSIDSSSWGHGHVNCKSKGYWRDVFTKAGLVWDKARTDDMQIKIRDNQKITSNWYGYNLTVYRVGGV